MAHPLPAGTGVVESAELWRRRAAWGVAIAADFVQIVAFPFFWEGALSPIDDALDVLVAVALTALVGWHWSFLPSFLAKLTPALDLVPTWSAAMFLATRRGGRERPPISTLAPGRPAALERHQDSEPR